MFKKKVDKELDVTNLNNIIRTGKKILGIGYFMAIVCLILLGTAEFWALLGDSIFELI